MRRTIPTCGRLANQVTECLRLSSISESTRAGNCSDNIAIRVQRAEGASINLDSKLWMVYPSGRLVDGLTPRVTVAHEV
jgi:hypothetical protein